MWARAMHREALLVALVLATLACQRGPSLHAVYHVSTDVALERKMDAVSIDLEMRLHVPVARSGPYGVLVGSGQMPRISGPLVEMSRDQEKAQVLLGPSQEFAEQVRLAALKNIAETLRGRLANLDASGVRLSIGRDTVVVDAARLPRDRIDTIRRVLLRQADLQFHMVDEANNEWFASLAPSAPASLRLERRSWLDAAGAREHLQVVYIASSRFELEAFFAAHPAPISSLVGYEHSPEGTWRAFLLLRRPDLTGDDLSDAYVDWDKEKNVPVIGVGFDDRGSQRLADVSARNIGGRMAIVFEGVVKMAPVIDGKLGKAIHISLGTGTPMQLQQEAKDFVGMLRSGSLAAPIQEVAFAVTEEKK